MSSTDYSHSSSEQQHSGRYSRRDDHVQQQQQQHHHHHPVEKRTSGRRLYGTVTLWQDWDDEQVVENNESEPKYWELFTDLLLVAAASSMADAFQAEQNGYGFLEFVLLYSTMIHGWLMYAHHYTSRFLETSLLHSAILFFYLLGMAATIVHASLQTAQEFLWGVVLQRTAFLAMMLHVLVGIPRAQRFAMVVCLYLCLTIVLYMCAALFGENKFHRILCLWAPAAVMDYVWEFLALQLVPGRSLVPINIDHSKDRLGVLVLVMMGETVISATIMYREYLEHDLEPEKYHQLYLVLAFSFLLVFMFTLLFFHIQPAPEDHAFRRSRPAALLCLICNKTLGLTLLMVGVCIKMAVHAVAKGQPLTTFTCYLLNVAVGGSMLLLFGIRCCHYWGKLPHPSYPPVIINVMWSWWIVFAVGSIGPFFFPHWHGAPIPPLIVSSCWLLVLCLVETCYTHYLGEYVVVPRRGHSDHAAAPAQGGGEAAPLLGVPPATVLLLRNSPEAVVAAKPKKPEKHVLVLISRQSLDRKVQQSQDQALTILAANQIVYRTIDGADPENLNKRNELFELSGVRARYPQFFLVHEQSGKISFWGGWDKFQGANELGEVATAFALAVAK